MNLTSLNFNFNLYENDHLLYTNEGDAHLSTSFYLASETDHDVQNGEWYGSYEYWKRNKDCWFSVRIGIDKDKNGKERAVITYGCENQPKGALVVNHCPVLRAE